MFYNCLHDYIFIGTELRDSYGGMDTIVWRVNVYECRKCGKRKDVER